MIRRIASALLALVLTIGPALAAETARVPSPNGTMVTEIYKPPGNGPFPVVIFSHGRSGNPKERAGLTRPIGSNVAYYWMAKGFAVVAPIRPGYGPTGGPDREADDSPYCSRPAKFANTASGAATAIVATVEWVRRQPWAEADRIVLAGHSVGGLGTVAAAARHPAGVVAFVNFSGGMGGFPVDRPGDSCQPEVLTSLYGEFGRSTRIPGIWFYAANDEFWGAEAPKQWARAYRAGNPQVTTIFTGPVPNGRGHSLLTAAPELWRPDLERFLRNAGFQLKAGGPEQFYGPAVRGGSSGAKP